MQTKSLASLLTKDEILKRCGSLDTKITGICYDSRLIQPGSLFVALPGLHTDGHLFTREAIRRGAVAILHSQPLPTYQEGISYIRVNDTRRALSHAAAAYYDQPAQKLITIGVSGTDGKSTTVGLIHQILEAQGYSAGFISTVQRKIGDEVEKNPFRQSTPEAPEIQKMLRNMLHAGKRVAVIEASSHGLSHMTHRLSDVSFDAALVTNLTHEHLEFHGSFERYRADKANLFRMIKRNGFGVVNLDDAHHHYFMKVANRSVYSYSIDQKRADLYASSLSCALSGTSFTVHWQYGNVPVRTHLPGMYNVSNLLAATLTVSRLLDINIDDLALHYPQLQGLPGRFIRIDVGQPFQVVVDFAHTPHAFQELMSFLRPRIGGRLLAVFGSAGERYIEKRPQQGNIASRFCDVVILTDEDPRGEDRMKILGEIATGCRRLIPGTSLFLEPDRRLALRLAFQNARPNDTVLLLGKGHEESIITAQGPLEWNEVKEAEHALAATGHTG